MKEYIIGVDAGATKTHLAIFNTEGGFVDFRRWGTLNHEALPGSFAQFNEEIKCFLDGALAENNISHRQIAMAVMGIAGVDTQKQHDIIHSLLSEQGFHSLKLCNDAFLGISAGIPHGVGICANNGTGATLAGINKAGTMLQIGGVDEFSDDRGGSLYLGYMVTSRVYRQLFRKGEPTLLTELLFQELGISDKSEYIECLRALEAVRIASFNRFLFEAAGQGDAIAQEVLDECAENFAGGLTVMMQELSLSPADTEIVLMGSVFTKEKRRILIDKIKLLMQDAYPEASAQYHILQCPPVAGAVAWAYRLLYGHSAYYEAVVRQLQEKMPAALSL